ncbi:ATP-binding protein [Tolumonas lignilytica]|uniref:ATP-binding protein n=1 Tax=Tolumonas lignilytica TaxID=1283284 RepID=UPI001F1CB898|nr:ATP-binding protein [Tolumonas lignilytica]
MLGINGGNGLLRAISDLLHHSPGMKGRQIAKELGLDKSQVNSFLHKNQDTFVKNSNHEWCLIRTQHVNIDFATGWIDAKAFEVAIGKLAYQKDINKVTFRFGAECKFLLIALARFLALSNQLIVSGKDVVIDTTACPNTHSFFSRNGFFDYLSQSATCLPDRPLLSAAKTYRDNSDTLVELGEIALPSKNKELIIRLGDRFVEHSSANYTLAAKTVFSELVGNVTDHSESKIPGLAGLQVYRPYNKPKHIQTVISDSGLGIATTLRTTLQNEYPKLYAQFSEETVENDIALVQKAFTSGEVSRFGKGRGLGFKSSREHASKEKVIIIIRQLTFSLVLEYSKGQLINVSEERGLVPITGTHICFDFYVDNF